jgi:adenylylsulfate kinase
MLFILNQTHIILSKLCLDLYLEIMTLNNNIFSVFDKVLSKAEKERQLNQQAVTIWLTGLSGSGKTTIAVGLEKKLHQLGFLTQVLDGDNIRSGINQDLNFSNEDRVENIRRIAEVSKLFVNCGVITINCFVSPTIEIRAQAKSILKDSFIEVFINTPITICEKRDVKGLYKKARKGEIKDFTGISAPFESPKCPNIEIKTALQSVEESVEELFVKILPIIKYG